MRQYARVILATGVAAVLASGAAASYAGVRQAGSTVKVGSTSDTNVFVPKDVSVARGADGKVTVEFTATGTHTIQSDQVKGFDSGIITDQTKSITFAVEPGKYDFYCKLHKGSGMVGTLTVTAGGAASSAPPSSAASTSAAPATESASPTASAEAGAPTASASAEGVPGVAGNKTLAKIEEERAAQHGAVSGFRYFTMVAVAFMVLLSAGVLFSTRPRRAAR